MRITYLVAALAAAPAFAWGPIGVNDAGCLIWDYDEVMDAGLTALPDGGLIGPAGACIELVEVSGDHLRKKKYPPFDGPTLPGPPGTYVSVGIPSQDGGTKPLNPFGDTPLGFPLGVCADGQGWSFETGTWQGWTPVGALSTKREGPVYGNNVHIQRLKPPGYVIAGPSDAGMNATIGGDYWMFSRDVNQQGDYWIGSIDRRKDWTEFPGQMGAEGSVSAVYSPSFIIGTDYLDFWLGGGVDVSQRVELQIAPQGGWSQAALLASFDGIGVSEFPPGAAGLVKTEGSYVVVRASSPVPQDNGENDYLSRHVGWDVKQFKFLVARLKIVDAARASLPPGALSHVNADHFRCTNTLDPKHAWLFKSGGVTAKVGHALRAQPLWGATDLHSHAVSNVSFGGHLVWGDVSDPLSNVYNCDNPLPAITRLDGGVMRKAINPPDVHTDCYVNFGIEILANVVANIACVAMSAGLAAIPFVGPVLAAEEIATCTAAVAAATIGLLSSPVMVNYSLHGGLSPISGGLDLGEWLETIAELISGGEIHIPGVIEELDHDLPDGTHSGRFGRLHQQYQHQMITRAWQGGLRLVVLDSINGRLMQALLDQKVDYDDWEAIRDSVLAARRLTACPGDLIFKPGPLCGIAEIARTPLHARRIIAGYKIAIVLGTEVDELGKHRTPEMMKLFGRNGETDSHEKQVADLWAWGIRKVTAIHGIDNPLGGTGIFNDVYSTSQQYHNLTRTETLGTDGTWEDWKPGSDYALPMSFVDPLAGLVLGTFTPGAKLHAKNGVTNNGLVEVETSTPSETIIGGYDDITHRIGFQRMAHPLTRFRGDYDIGNVHVDTGGSPSAWIPMKYWGGIETTSDADERQPLLAVLKTHDLGWILGNGPGGLGGSSRCTMDNAHLPLPIDDDEIGPASDNYGAAPLGHFNKHGLSGTGVKFAREMMKRAMAFDLDHFSQRGRLDAYQEAQTFADEALSPTRYATFGVHTNFRGLEKSGPVPEEYVTKFGVGTETDRTGAELELVRASGGVVSPAANASFAPFASFGSTNNNCDYSSKAWSQKYLAFMVAMKGHGIGMSTDMNGLTTPMAPRFGLGACHTDITSEDDFQSDTKQVHNWPRDFPATGTGGSACKYNTRKDGPNWDPACPSSTMVAEQHQEASAVIYEDYASRVVSTLSTTPLLIQRVRARGTNEVRDDVAPRPHEEELVTIGGSRQLFPLKKFKNSPASNNTGWDYNVDGLKHIGMYPDFFQDIRNGGVTFEQLTPLFNSAEEYVRMWERNCELAEKWAGVNGGADPGCKGTGGAWPSF